MTNERPFAALRNHIMLAWQAFLCVGLLAAPAAMAAGTPESPEIPGGLIVHVGCRDGKETMALRTADTFLVHALDRNAENIAKARARFRDNGVAGAISADVWTDGPLPYADNVVNVLVIEDGYQLPDAEIMRVMTPNGIIFTRRQDAWRRTVKPWPKAMDEWTHALHSPNNNAVADDTVVGSPRQLQWLADPPHARSHEHLATLSAFVSAGGRLFYIVDEGPTLTVGLPARWTLIARDAFNGVELWRRTIDEWESHLRGFRMGPADIFRRLVAIDDRVYVTLGYGSSVTALDAASGRTVKTYKGTEDTSEILVHDGTLYLLIADIATRDKLQKAVRRGNDVPASQQRILAVRADTGKLLWSKQDEATVSVKPTTLTVHGKRVLFQNGQAVVCLDAGSGKALWRTPRATGKRPDPASPPTLVAYDDVILSADPGAPPPPEDPDAVKPTFKNHLQHNPGELVAMSLTDGKPLWRARCYPNFRAPCDVIVADGVVWMGQLSSVVNMGVTEARDLHTGKIVRKRPPDDPDRIVVSHHRCHRYRATNRFLLLSRAGIELQDVKTGKMLMNHWIRGTCQHGPVPCNGLIYATPHACACYVEAMVHGFAAMASGEPKVSGPVRGALLQGPAYGKTCNTVSRPGDWPTYRGHAARSGVAATKVPAGAALIWQRRLGRRLSAPTVTAGSVFVSDIDAHTVHALKAEDGRSIWAFTTDGRVDSPPTVADGRVLFGCADGRVYCLSAQDGALQWRFQAAPAERRIVVRNRLESAWPVHGSVLVHNNEAWFVAGRTAYLDGGLFAYRLDPTTGQQLSATRIDLRDPEIGMQPANAISGFGMPGVINDILSSDGNHVFVRHSVLDKNGDYQPQTAAQHLFSPAGFLDDSWFHRTYWIIGARMDAGFRDWARRSGIGPYGRLLCLAETAGYGFGRTQAGRFNSHVGIDKASYHLFAFSAGAEDRTRWETATGEESAVRYLWKQKVPALVRAMVVADKIIFAAGPPDLLAEKNDKAIAAIEGRRGALLLAVDVATGRTSTTQKLKSPPVFDGMAAANGRLYLSCLNGEVICLGAK